MGFLSNIFGKKAEANASVDFEVSMSCDNCVKHIEKLMAENKAVVNTKIDLPSKMVSLQYDKTKTSKKDLQESIEALGYEVSEK